MFAGRISFKEFLLGMVKLVVQELEDDELQVGEKGVGMGG
jgi:hypothetical protein